jgi:IPT/TIG domain-containing protein/all-beta uncharacterized protein/BACON domain-containing protein
MPTKLRLQRFFAAILAVAALHATARPARADCQVFSITPALGPGAGGDQVTILGTNFRQGVPGPIDVTFGGTTVTGTAVNATTIVATTPPGGGTISIQVNNGTNMGTCTLNDGYQYVGTLSFVGDPVAAGSSPIKAQYIGELRDAIDQVRRIAGRPTGAWTDPTFLLGGQTLKAVHVSELRSRLFDAMMGHYPIPIGSDPIAPGGPVKASHIQTLRDQLKNIGPACTYTLSSQAFTVPADEGNGGLHVTTAAPCVWSAVSTTDWISVTNSPDHQGTGDVTLSFGANPGSSARSAVVWTGDQRVTITQEAGSGPGTSCPESVSPAMVTANGAGGTGIVDVFGSANCTWTAVSTQPSWLTVSGGGTGTGALTYTVTENTSNQSRSAQILVHDTSIPVIQAGTGQAACDVPNGNDDQDDSEAIQCLLDQGEMVVLNADVTKGYYIAKTLLLSRSGTHLTSTSASGYQALLWAMPELRQHILDVDDQTSGYTISNIFFYGNKFARSVDCENDDGVNVRLLGSAITVDNVISEAAPCNSGMEVDGSHGVTITNSWFAYNGTPQSDPSGAANMISDGLTLWSCVDGSIHDNHFVDNTDVDLIVGGGSSCAVFSNYIDHYATHGLAGLMLHRFQATSPGDHTGISYSDNVVTSQRDMLAFGILVGAHPWNSAFDLPGAGSVSGNRASGAVINLQIEADMSGTATGQVTNNMVSGAQGTWGLGSCRIASNYAVHPPHTGRITYDGGWDDIQFDDFQCVPR